MKTICLLAAMSPVRHLRGLSGYHPVMQAAHSTRFVSVIILAFLAATSACKNKGDKATESEQPDETKPLVYDAGNGVAPQDPVDVSDFAASINAFGLDLYGAAAKEPGNLFFSPASISVAFAMTYAGARAATAEEMHKVLHLPPADIIHDSAQALLNDWNGEHDAYQLRVVNRLFGEKTYSFIDAFLARVAGSYAAPLEKVDFKGAPKEQRLHINKWVMQQTENRIDELLPGGSVSSDTRLVLVNAIYFLGTWESAFNAKATQDKDFFVDGKTAKKVPTMTKTQSYKYAKGEGFQFLEMGYDGSTLVMNLLLPDEPLGLPALEAQMSVENINTWWSKLHSQEITLELPRFELKDQRIPLKQILKTLGMNAAFDEKLADFGAMAVTTPDARLYISDAFHEAFIKVDEKGTEAAAATAVLVAKPASVPSPPKMFQVKHPFLFVIRDTANGAILFMGRVTDPAP